MFSYSRMLMKYMHNLPLMVLTVELLHLPSFRKYHCFAGSIEISCLNIFTKLISRLYIKEYTERNQMNALSFPQQRFCSDLIPTTKSLPDSHIVCWKRWETLPTARARYSPCRPFVFLFWGYPGPQSYDDLSLPQRGGRWGRSIEVS